MEHLLRTSRKYADLLSLFTITQYASQWSANLVVLVGIVNSDDVVKRPLSSWKLSSHTEVQENLIFFLVPRVKGRASLETSSTNCLYYSAKLRKPGAFVTVEGFFSGLTALVLDRFTKISSLDTTWPRNGVFLTNTRTSWTLRRTFLWLILPQQLANALPAPPLLSSKREYHRFRL